MSVDKPRGRPGTRRKWQSQEDNEIAARLLLAMDGFMPVKWVSRADLEDAFPKKGEIIAEMWARRPEWHLFRDIFDKANP